MKPTEVAKAIISAVKAMRPAFIWGPPAVGKSATVQQVAKTTGRRLYDIRVALLDPVDMRGLPEIKSGLVHWCTPEFWPQDPNEKSILFLDELSSAPALVQAGCYQLVLDRRIGEYTLPANCAIIAAGNRQEDRAVVSRMSTALASRFATHITMEPDLNDWCVWALSAGIQPEVIAFLRFRPALLHSFDPAKNDEKAFPSPRTWHFASDLMAAGLDKDIELETLSGSVGQGAATEFCAFLSIFRTLPNPDAVLMRPDTADVPTDPATLYALTGALARKSSATTIDRICTYANRLPAEFSVLLVRDAINTDPRVQNSKGYIDWTVKHQDVLV